MIPTYSQLSCKENFCIFHVNKKPIEECNIHFEWYIDVDDDDDEIKFRFFFPFLKLTLLQVQEIRGYQNDYSKSRRTAASSRKLCYFAQDLTDQNSSYMLSVSIACKKKLLPQKQLGEKKTFRSYLICYRKATNGKSRLLQRAHWL